MAIQMTRAEYEAKYGTKAPVATSTAPIQMTRAEYESKYGAKSQVLPPTKPSISDDFKSRVEKGADVIQKGVEGKRSNVEVGLGLLGQGAGFIGDLAGRAISAVTPDPIGELALKPVRAVAQSGFGQAVGKGYKALPERARENIEAVGNVASILPIGKGAQLTKQGVDKTLDVTGKVLAPSVKTVEKNIVRDFEKAVKPLLPSRATPATAQKYKDEIVNAVKIINDNPELSFVDEIGEKVTGKKPSSLQELSEAVDQTKKSVYKQYNDLAKQAGESGVKINTNSIASELDNVIKNEALQISNPEAVKYAFDLKERLKFRDLDAETAQNVIQNYNKSLEAFYRNPTYDNASKASIDALIVNQLRQKLDEAITNTTGSQYQPLKNQYASLKTIERDVIKAALRDARKNNKGLIDFTDIFTGGDIITGILTLNPSQLARGAFSRGIKEFYSYLNSPNRAIKNVFKNADRLNQRLPKSQSTPSNMSSAVPSGNSLLQSQPAKSIPTTPNINAIPQSLQQPAKSSNKLSTPKTLPKNSSKNVVPLSLSNNLKVTNAYGDSFLGFNLKEMEKRANESGYNLYDNLLKRVDAEDDMTKKIEAMQDILEEIMVAKPKKGMLQSAIDNLKDPKMRQGGYIRNPLAKKELPVQKSSSLNDITDLLSEAKKYKTAEDFVKAQPNIAEYTPLTEQQTNRNIKLLNESGIPVKSGDDILTLYHGTNLKGVKGITESNSLNPFSYLATDKNASKGFVFGKGGDILEIKVPVKDAGFVQTSMAGSKGVTIQNPVRLVKGKDGIWRAEEWKTKSQLEDIWKQAQGKSLSNDLIEASVASKLPPRTVERMKPNFTPELKKNIAEIIDAQRGIKKVSPEKMIELEADMSSIIEDFGFAIPRTKAGRLKLLDLIYNQAI